MICWAWATPPNPVKAQKPANKVLFIVFPFKPAPQVLRCAGGRRDLSRDMRGNSPILNGLKS